MHLNNNNNEIPKSPTCILKQKLSFSNDLISKQTPPFTITLNNLNPNPNPILTHPIPTLPPTRTTHPTLSSNITIPTIETQTPIIIIITNLTTLTPNHINKTH
jgi:hypothetical protein